MPALDNRVWYCTREDVQDTNDLSDTVRDSRRIDRAIAAGARTIEGLCHRTFYPWTGTRYFDWPNPQRAGAGVLWLDDNEIISLTALTSGGVTIAPADYFLEPNAAGPPYSAIRLDRSSNSAFSSGDTFQRAIAGTGEYGGPCGELPGGTITEALDGSATTLTLSDPTSVGVGDLLRIDSERLIVTDKLMVSTGVTIGASLAASKNVVTVPVASGAAFTKGEEILVGAEQMQIDVIAGNNLIVRRGDNGSILAAHNSGDTIYSLRTAAVTRAAVGTTAASHLDNAPIYKNDPPALVREANVALALNAFEQGGAGYGRTVGSGEGEREAGGRGVKAILDDLYRTYGRKARMRSV